MDIDHQESNFEEAAKFFKLLSHPARLKILNEINREEACVCHLEAVLGLRQAYISQQLMVLREAGLIRDRRDGWNVFYEVADPKVAEIIEISNKFFGNPISYASHSDPGKCTCPKCSQGNIIDL